MKNLLTLILLSISTTSAAQDYTAIISCGLYGDNINIAACFEDSDLKITKDGHSTIYKIYTLQTAGQVYRNGLHVDLPKSFSIVAQNSSEHLVLGIIIRNVEGNIVFQDEAGTWGVIAVGN